MRSVGHVAAVGTGQPGGNPAVGRDMAFEEEDAPRMLGTDDLGGGAVEGRQLAPLVAPGLIQEVVADHAWGLREGAGNSPQHQQVPRAGAAGVGVEVIERAVRRRVGGHHDGPALAAGRVFGIGRIAPWRDRPARKPVARSARRVARESVLVDIDDHVYSPGRGCRRNRLKLDQVTVVVHPGDRLVSFPDEKHPHDVEAQLRPCDRDPRGWCKGGRGAPWHRPRDSRPGGSPPVPVDRRNGAPRCGAGGGAPAAAETSPAPWSPSATRSCPSRVRLRSWRRYQGGKVESTSKPYLDMRHSTLENKLLYLHEMTSPRPFAKARPSETRGSIHSGR